MVHAFRLDIYVPMFASIYKNCEVRSSEGA